jgi:23S rRNA (guanine745-N1)-methyltransferase
VCSEALDITGKSYICPSRHTFDIAKEGYVNFALGKSESGDSAQMCLSRRNFLSKGYYSRFSKLICDTVEKYCNPGSLCDAGCGEGYYLRGLRERFADADLFGIDLAKEAVKLAAKAEKQSSLKKNLYSVCGIFSLPFDDGSLDAVISVFAPVGDAENFRVLKKGGYMFVAGPGKTHLSGLKSAIYEKPYENREKHVEYEGFEYVGKEAVLYKETVFGDDIRDLFTMTPYYWKTSKEDSAKLCSLGELETELSFEISVYRSTK